MLDQIYGSNNILYTDVQLTSASGAYNYHSLDVSDHAKLRSLVNEFKPD